MTLEELMRDAPIPESAEVRERTVAAARTQIAARPAPTARTPRRRRLTIAFAAVLLGAALLTPPGRAATAWVGDLVGIGDVGGEATLTERTFAGKGPAIVINNGFAPDGSRYEWVAYGCSVNLRDEGLSERFDGFGLSLEWPGTRLDGGAGGGTCAEAREPGEARGLPFTGFGTQIVPSQFKGVDEPDLVVSGSTTPKVHGVRVVYTDGSGGRHELKVDFERIGPDLRDKVTASAELGGTFVAFVPGEWAARDELASRLDLRALQGTGKLELGPLARRDRREACEASDLCAPKQPNLSRAVDPDDTKALEEAFAPYRRCLDAHMPPSPIQYIALDEHGRELGRQPEPLFIPAPRESVPVIPRFKERPTDPDAVGKPVVLKTGRSPDGGRYEFYVERFADSDGKTYGRCVQVWWPRAGVAASGSCGPGLPPSTAYGKRHPERVAAKPYGFLQDARPSTKYLMLSGYARPSVSRVRVVYTDRGGQRRDAPVELRPVDGALAERVAAEEPFGFFVAFVAPGARHEPIAVIAYDAAGHELSRYQHSDPLLN